MPAKKGKSTKKEILELRQLEQIIRDLRDDKTLLECEIERERDKIRELDKRAVSFNLRRQAKVNDDQPDSQQM